MSGCGSFLGIGHPMPEDRDQRFEVPNGQWVATAVTVEETRMGEFAWNRVLIHGSDGRYIAVHLHPEIDDYLWVVYESDGHSGVPTPLKLERRYPAWIESSSLGESDGDCARDKSRR